MFGRVVALAISLVTFAGRGCGHGRKRLAMSEVVWAATLALPTLPAKLVAIPVSTAEIGFEMSDAFRAGQFAPMSRDAET